MIRNEDQPVRIQRRLVRNLLFYLACQQDMVPRASLLYMFWENFNEQDARRRLRETLSKLRSHLPDPSVLVTEQDLVGLDRKKAYIDLDEFRSIIQDTTGAAGLITKEGSLPAAAVKNIEKAINLWRGPQLLSGIEFYESIELEQWLTGHQEELSQKLRTLQIRIAEHHFFYGNFEKALDYLHQLLLSDTLDQDVNILYIRCLVELGRISEAIHRIRDLEHLYRTELQANLPPVFLNLRNEINERLSIREIPAVSKWSITVAASNPFFGMQDKIAELTGCYQKGGLVLLSGEAGSGKTRLVYELYKSFQPAPLLLATSASSLGRNLPYQTILQIIRENIQLGERITDPKWKNQISRFLPHAFSRESNFPNFHHLEESQSRIILLETMQSHMLDIFRGENALVFLDNSQWLDDSTLDFMIFLLENGFFSSNRLLVMAYRPEIRRMEKESWFNRLANSSNVSVMNLSSLDVSAVGEMTAYLLGEVPTEQMVRQLEKQSGGNPYFLIEILDIIRQSHAALDREDKYRNTPLPKSISMLLQERLNALSIEARETLIAAAVIRENFSPSQLEEVTGIPAEKMVSLLEELESAHFIQPSENQLPGGAYNFIHEIIGEILYETLSLSRKRFLHQSVSRALQNHPIPVHPAILAFHFEAAGDIHTAIEYWIQAGEASARLLSKEQAYHAFQQAEKLLNLINFRIDPNLIYRLYSIWGELTSSLFDHPEIKNVYQRMLSIGTEIGDDLIIGTAKSGLAATYQITDDYLEGINLFDESIQHLERSGNVYEIIRTSNKKGSLQSTFCHFNKARITLNRANSLGMGNPDPRIVRALISTDIYLSYVESSSGWGHRGIEYAERAKARSEQTGYQIGEIRATALLAAANFNLGNFWKAREYCHQGLERITGLNLLQMEAQFRTIASATDLALGNIDSALAHNAHISKVINLPGFASIKTYYFICIGDIYRFLQEYSKALINYEEALKGIKVSYNSIQILHRTSFVNFILKNYNEANKIIDDVIELAKLGDAAQIFLQAELTKTLVYSEIGRLDEAYRINEVLINEFSKRSMLYQLATAYWIKGFLNCKSKNYTEARNYTNSAIQQTKELGMIWLEFRCHELLKDLPDSRHGQPYEDISRIHELLDLVGEHTKSDEYKPYYDRFKVSILNKFA